MEEIQPVSGCKTICDNENINSTTFDEENGMTSPSPVVSDIKDMSENAQRLSLKQATEPRLHHDVVLETNVVHQTDVVLRTDVVPETDVVPQTDAVPETDVVPQTDAVPETNVVHQTDAVLRTDVVPEHDAVPETDAVPQSCAVPGPDAVLQIDAVPETDVTPASFCDCAQAHSHYFSEGTFEMEVLTQSAEGEVQWRGCMKNAGHKNFIPVSEFTIQHLPEPYRSREHMELIELISKLTIRIRVKHTSVNRSDRDPFSAYRGKRVVRTGSGVVMASMTGECPVSFDTTSILNGNPVEDTDTACLPDVSVDRNLVKDFGNKYLENFEGEITNLGEMYDKCDTMMNPPGMPQISESILDSCSNLLNDFAQLIFENASDLFDEPDVVTGDKSEASCHGDKTEDEPDARFSTKVSPCPCPECTNSSNAQTTGYVFPVFTARHVVFDEEEIRNTVVDLFCDDISETGVEHLYGFRMRACDGVSDTCVLECVTHNYSLFRKLEELERQFMDRIMVSVNNKPPVAVICSHPHGCFKHITLGEWTRRWLHPLPRLPGLPFIRSSYEYTTPTCPGSSGAPVLLLGQKVNTRCIWSGLHFHFGSLHDNINRSGVQLGTEMKDCDERTVANMKSLLKLFQ